MDGHEPVVKIAQFISAIFSPYIVAIFAFFIVSFSATKSLYWGLVWTLISVGFMIAPLFLYVFYGVRKGRITDLHIRERTQRNRVYVLGLITTVLIVLVLWIFNAPRQLLAFLLSVMIASGVSFLINRRWKISLHAATMGGTTAALFFLVGPIWGGIGFAISLLVMWSRVVTKSHTAAQTLAGFALTFVVTYAFFSLFGFA